MDKIKSVFAFIAIAFLVASVESRTKATGLAPEASGRTCERIKVPMCMYTGYNFTYMPNKFNHTNQERVTSELYQYFPLIKVQCSTDFQLLVCSLYVPKCSQNEGKLPPCRSVCLSARAGCLPLMNKFGMDWPAEMSCDGLPTGSAQCIGRSRVTTKAPRVRKPKVPKRGKKQLDNENLLLDNKRLKMSIKTLKVEKEKLELEKEYLQLKMDYLRQSNQPEL